MDVLHNKIQEGLQEDRILVLGSQVILGFAFIAPFQPGFPALPKSSQYLIIASLELLLVTYALLLLPIEGGTTSSKFHRFLTKSLEAALFPFILALGILLYIPVQQRIGSVAGLLSGIFGSGLALFFWWGIGLVKPMLGDNSDEKGGEPAKKEREKEQSDLKKIESKISDALMEVRIVLPGLQALLGFQFSVTIHQSFDQLPAFVKSIHLASLLLVALCIILLMSPAAHHRIAERGSLTERVHRFTSIMIIAAMVLLPIGLNGDVFVAVYKVTENTFLGIIMSSVTLLVCYGLWFVLMIYLRKRHH